jgi:ATP-dependent helicase/nuclease subunit B
MDVFFNQVAELCRSERTAPKWVLLRNARLAYTLAERVVREGTDWVNLHCQTLFHLALDLAAPYLLESGIDPAPEGLGPGLMTSLLAALPAQTPGHFRPLLEQPRIGESLWSTLSELRMSGLTANDLQSDTAKQQELRALLGSYENYLCEHHLADRAAVYTEALLQLANCPIAATDFLLAAPDCAWSALERKLLDRLPGRHLRARALGLVTLERPRRLPDWIDWVAPSATSDAGRLAWTDAPREAPPTLKDQSLQLFAAGGREAEIEEVLRRVLSRELPLDQVELTVTRPDMVALIWEKLERHQLRGTFENGVPALLTRPGRGLSGFLAWVEGGFAAHDLRQWLQSGVIKAPPEAGRLLERVAPSWGRQTYARVLGEAAARLELQEEPEQEAIDELRRLEAWIAALLHKIPEEPFPLESWLLVCHHVVKELTQSESALDRSARSQILLALSELEPLKKVPYRLSDASRLVRERLEKLSVGAARSAPGALHVTGLATATWSGRPYLFGLGFEQGHFRSGSEDPVLLDAERRALSTDLPTSEDRVTEAVWAALSRLACGARHVCLSYSCQDLRDARKMPPSWPFMNAARLLWPGIETHEQLFKQLGNPCSVVPADADDALHRADWWMASLRGYGPSALPQIRKLYRGLDRGLEAESRRASRELTAWSGWVSSAAGIYDPRLNGQSVSSSLLESLGACPFRYFLHYVLGLRPLQVQPPDPNCWLDAMTRGSLLHDVFADYHRQLRRRQNVRHDLEMLMRLGERRLARYLERVPPVSQQLYEHERSGFERDLRRFYELEVSAENRHPVALEVSFGLGRHAEGEPLDRNEPISVAGLQLQGRMDRVDRLENGDYEVVDYKTGSDWGQDKQYRGGRKLQFALYALAAGELLRPLAPQAKVRGTLYYHPTDSSRQPYHFRAFPSAEQVQRMLDDLLHPTTSGVFLQSDTEDDCRMCDFKPVCGAHPHLRSNLKISVARDHLRRLRQND